jgi:hypothetical protein
VYREIDVAMLARRFAVVCPPAPAASRHYSVDVVFRLLPDLWGLARAVSERDPLMNHLRTLATAWPLSSVGVPNVVECDVSVIRGHASLLRMYADRVIAWQDVSRLDDPRVRATIREAIGHFDTLAAGRLGANVTEDEARRLVAAVGRLAPEDRLLQRDGNRFLAIRRQRSAAISKIVSRAQRPTIAPAPRAESSCMPWLVIHFRMHADSWRMIDVRKPFRWAPIQACRMQRAVSSWAIARQPLYWTPTRTTAGCSRLARVPVRVSTARPSGGCS